MAKANVTIYRGTSYPMTYTHPTDMTGGTLYFTVKPTEFDDSAPDTTGMPKATVTSFTNGGTLASWTLTETDTYVEPGNYFYDIVFQDSTGISFPPIFEGKFKILPHPTNRNVS